MKEFIGTKIVKAAPALRLDDGKGGKARNYEGNGHGKKESKGE